MRKTTGQEMFCVNSLMILEDVPSDYNLQVIMLEPDDQLYQHADPTADQRRQQVSLSSYIKIILLIFKF